MSSESHNVARNAALVGSMTGVSRILGLVREVLTARIFGTSAVQSAFVVAFMVPNLFRRLFGEGALSAAFVPVFTENLRKRSKAAAHEMARRLLTMLAALLTAVVALGIVTAWVAGRWAEPGSRLAMILPLLRIMLPYAVFICLAAIYMGMLNALGDYRSPALAPALLNVFWIAALVGVCPLLPDDMWVRIVAVAWTVLGAGAAQWGYLALKLRRDGWPMRWQGGGARDEQVRRVWRKTLPAAVGAGVIQINVCIDSILAYWAAPWAPSVLSYADRIILLPIGLVATAFGTVLLPVLSAQFTDGDHAAVRRTFRLSLGDLMLVMVPATAGLMALAVPVVGLLYQRGEFDAQSTARTARALACYAPGLVMYSFHKVLTPLFYGMQDTRTPMVVSVWTVLLNLILNVTFVLTLPVEWKHAGIAGATVISSTVACVALSRIAARRVAGLGQGKLLGMLTRIAAAAVLMALAAWWTHHAATNGLAFLGMAALRTGSPGRILALAAAGVAGAAVYLAGLRMLCPAELRHALRRVLRRREN